MGIAIYGAGEVGKRVCHNLLDCGISPLAFFDQKARKGEKLLGIPMLQVKDYSSFDCPYTTVIIALSDGLAHKEVADSLHSRGFRKLVFLPIAYNMPSALKTELTILYNEYIDGRATGAVRDYSCYAGFLFMDAGQAVVSENVGSVVAWVPLEIVFTENLERWPGDKKLLKSPFSYYDRNIATNYWVLNLIDYLQGTNASCDTYLSMYERNGGTKPSIEKRRLQFEVFEHEYSFGMNFFINSAPEAMWNNRGYFNIVGGNHRIMYLYAKGCRYFPLRISRKDFARWQGRDIIVEDIVANIGYPVSHPAFQHIVLHGTGHIYRKFKAIEEQYGHADMSDITILDLSYTQGFFGRQFARMKGTNVAVAVSSDELAFYAYLNKLMHQRNMNFIDDDTLSADCLDYDIVIYKDEHSDYKIRDRKVCIQ